VAADGYYEWEQLESGRKQPWFFHPAEGGPLAFAGLWAVWRPSDGSAAPIRTCTILTTAAVEPVAGLHARMPVALPGETWESWLGNDADPRALLTATTPPPLVARRVSTRVNDVRNNGPELVEALS
jgi:putative SOS response-associated peptidase YedK